MSPLSDTVVVAACFIIALLPLKVKFASASNVFALPDPVIILLSALLLIVVPVTVLKVESPARKVDEFAVPDPNLAVGTVPDAMFDALRLVIFEPLIAAAVPESCAAGKLVKDAPEPEKLVEVVTPLTTRPF